MLELNYKFKVEWMVDSVYEDEPAICIYYTVRWYHGNFPWIYTDEGYKYYIPTYEPKDEDEINPFAHLKARDIPNGLVHSLICLDIENNHLEDGMYIVAKNRRKSIYRWSHKFVRRTDYNEQTGLTRERESAIIELKKEWYGEDK